MFSDFVIMLEKLVSDLTPGFVLETLLDPVFDLIIITLLDFGL